MTLAQILRDHFDRTREEQAAFARRLELKPQTVSQLLSGDIKVPKAWIRRKLAAEFGLRHVDILVMTGELSPDEIDPALQPVYPDDRLRVLAENWHLLAEERRNFIAYLVRNERRDHGLEDDDPPVAPQARAVR